MALMLSISLKKSISSLPFFSAVFALQHVGTFCCFALLAALLFCFAALNLKLAIK